ncbi:MAG TPA: tetratricopeptide repeat protein [Gemmatimonadales bacterium]|nr:tetratricopeptide repeat protein [Gemmatimonadales bacterium]
MAASEIEKLERMVRENPKGRLFASLADAYRKDGQYPKALEVLEAGLVNHPDYVSARVVLGRVHMSTGDRAKAREAFTRVVQLDPESVIALKALADLAEEEGQGEEALRWSGQLLTVDPGNDEAIKQQERLAAAAPAAVPPADAVPEVRLSGIVPMLDEPPAEAPPPAAAPVADEEKTAAPFEAVKPPILKTKEIPAIPVSGAPTFAAAPEPLEQQPEPLPLMGISEEAQTEQVASSVTPMAALEPTSFEGAGDAPTERMPGLDPVGMSEEEMKSISAAPGFEPNAGDVGDIPVPRTSLLGLETMSGELVGEQALPEPDAELEREQEIEITGSGSGTNEFQVDSAAETLQRRSGANEFQVSSDSDTLDASSARASEAIETGGTDLAFIEPDPSEVEAMPAYTPPPEDPEPAATEPEPVVTESMAELYAAQGHLADALDVYRQLAERDPGEPRYQERMVELEMYVGGGMPAAPAPIPVVTSAPAPAPVAAPVVAAAPRTAGSGESVGAWLASVFAQSLPGTTPAAEPAPMEPMAEAEPMMEPEPAPVAEEPEVLDLASEAAIPPATPRGEPTRPASGAFNLSNVFEAPKPAASGSFDDFFGAGASPAQPAAPKPAESAPARSTRPSGSQPPADDDVASFQDWLKGLKK